MLNHKWRKVIFAVAIAMLYIPMVYLGTNTFFPDFPQDKCYEARAIAAPCEKGDTACYALERNESIESQKCWNEYQLERKEYEGGKYIVLMLICLFTSFVMLLKLDVSIIYGLFFGVVITAFSGTLRYIESKSIIGFVLMVILFIVVIIFVQRMRKR